MSKSNESIEPMEPRCELTSDRGEDTAPVGESRLVESLEDRR